MASFKVAKCKIAEHADFSADEYFRYVVLFLKYIDVYAIIFIYHNIHVSAFEYYHFRYDSGLCVFHTHPTRKCQALLIFMLSYVCSRERHDIVKEELSEAMLAKVEIADTFVQCLLRVGCYMSYS